MSHRYLSAFLFLLALAPCPGLAQRNRIQDENALPGNNWQLTNPALGRDIEGYASLTSVNVGGQIDFSVSTTYQQFTIEIFRTGYYLGGVGARLMQTIPHLLGVDRGTPNPLTGMPFVCDWPSSYSLIVPSGPISQGGWTSGIYLARLTGEDSNENANGSQSYIIFVVRDDSSRSDLVFESSVTTYQAYNFWPGKSNNDPGTSLYVWAPGGAISRVSFNRPYTVGFSYTGDPTNPASYGAEAGIGAGEYLNNLQPGPADNAGRYYIRPFGFEYNMVRWLEKNGYDVTYITDLDRHRNAGFLDNHAAYLSVGHNEYWSQDMWDHLQNALRNGKNAAFFSSNSPCWRVEFYDLFNNGDSFNDQEYRTIECSKDKKKILMKSLGVTLVCRKQV